MITLAELDRKIGKILPEIRKIRHELHRIPEIAGKEYKTSALIREKLSDLGLDMKPPFLGTDVIALLNPEKSGNLTLRADIDALPIEENNENLPYRSAHPGMMHACGHDGHAAMLLGAAEILAGIRGSVPCSVRLLFQPGEEMAALAREVLKSGALQDPEPDFITGLHNFPDEEYGKINTRPGALMAAAGFFHIILHGKSGHGSLPKKANNPLECAAEIIAECGKIVPEDCVLTFCKCAGGNCNNVIPETAELLGTIRFFDPARGQKLLSDFENTVRQISERRKIKCDFSCDVPVIPVINRTEDFERTRRVITRDLGDDAFSVLAEPTMIAEDFSWYLQKYRGIFCHLGAGRSCPLHSNRYDFDDELLAYGIRYFCLMALHGNELFDRIGVKK